MNTAETRQRDLQQNYFFLCNCSKCLGNKNIIIEWGNSPNHNHIVRTYFVCFADPTESVIMNAAACPNDQCDECLNLDNLIVECGRCGAKVTDEFSIRFDEVMHLTKTHIENMKDIACEL